MMNVLWVIAFGFAIAGLLNALNKTVNGNIEESYEGALSLHFDTAGRFAWSSIMCVLAGPYLLFSNAIRYWRGNILSPAALSVCLSISVLWSFCSGVVLAEGLIAAGFLVV